MEQVEQQPTKAADDHRTSTPTERKERQGQGVGTVLCFGDSHTEAIYGKLAI